MTMRSQQSFMSFMNSKDSAIPRKDIDRLCCAKCRFSTKDTDLFERHVSHHEEVTFSCALCSYVSYSKTESQKHVVLHTGSYPYRCSFCSYGAVRRDYMVKHILRIHKRHAEEGFITDFTVSTLDTAGPSVPDALEISDWPERNDQCAIPNSHVEHPSGSQPDQSSVISKTVSQTRGNRARMTYSFTTPSMTNTTTVIPVSKTQFNGAIPSCAPSASHSLGNTPQVVLRSREANSNLSNAQLRADGRNKVVSSGTVSEKLIPKDMFPRVHVSSTEPLQQSPRVGVPEKAMASNTVPRVQVRAPVELNAALRPLLNAPLSKRNIQMDQRAGQSKTGTKVGTQKPVVLPSSPVKSPLHSSAEKSNHSRTNSRAPVGSSAETSSPLSSVQVELLAPLNQPIQHNKPLTVSCPEEINIPAGCLVELVEVKNVNGTRELELRLIPPNGIPQDKKSNMDEPSSAATKGKLSFKCQVAKGCPVSPSTSATSHKVKQQRPSTCTDVQTITKTVQSAHKPQCSSETPAKSKRNLKTKDPEIITLEGPELSSESLPVISSVFSLCPTPKSTQSISKSSPEMQRWKVATKEPKDEVKNAEQSLVCSILIKKEETEDKPKGASLGLKETKTEDETSEGSAISKTCVQVKTSEKTLNKSNSKQDPRFPVAHPLVVPNQNIVPSNKDDISHQDMGNSECESGRNLDGQQHHSCVSNMYPKVALSRIPSSLLEPTKKLPEAPTREESLMARPVLCCTLSEQNISGSPEVAIKLILKRNLCEREEKHQDSPPRKKHKKEKRKAKKRKSSSVGMGLHQFSTEDQELRLTPLKADQRIKLPGPNQPVVVLNHPNPSVQRVSVGVQTLKNYKWVHSVDHEQEQREQPARKRPSFKMKLKKVHGQKYQVIEFVLKGVSEKQLS
ncbi:zinc finger protein 518B [Sinocyclocheilus rhinocerous]|uniref:Zinc finger protein 518B-like n=1 Tax=Sinocyclocheilus rhinocerous TaxID=307959 RepID=A0A673J7A0_9TELE|nr:PREDICTED: zinc finger protein 518B-like [Sinocyclocheilus rhinocerous]XP_016386683.1 PREDICTED: zinc finger protein 518B-like [Sinocyclocheilus rhinocerous]